MASIGEPDPYIAAECYPGLRTVMDADPKPKNKSIWEQIKDITRKKLLGAKDKEPIEAQFTRIAQALKLEGFSQLNSPPSFGKYINISRVKSRKPNGHVALICSHGDNPSIAICYESLHSEAQQAEFESEIGKILANLGLQIVKFKEPNKSIFRYQIVPIS